MDGDDELVHLALAFVLGDDALQSHPTGALIGSLSVEEAERVFEVTEQFGNQRLGVMFNEYGEGRLVPVP